MQPGSLQPCVGRINTVITWPSEPIRADPSRLWWSRPRRNQLARLCLLGKDNDIWISHQSSIRNQPTLKSTRNTGTSASVFSPVSSQKCLHGSSPSLCGSFQANSLINQQLFPVDVLDFVSSRNVFTTRLTVGPQEVVVELEQREAVPRVDGLDLQSAVHVGSVQRQKRLGVFGHQLGPPRESLRRTRADEKSSNLTGRWFNSDNHYKLYFHREQRDLRRLKHLKKAACKTATSENVHGG